MVTSVKFPTPEQGRAFAEDGLIIGEWDFDSKVWGLINFGHRLTDMDISKALTQGATEICIQADVEMQMVCDGSLPGQCVVHKLIKVERATT